MNYNIWTPPILHKKQKLFAVVPYNALVTQLGAAWDLINWTEEYETEKEKKNLGV